MSILQLSCNVLIKVPTMSFICIAWYVNCVFKSPLTCLVLEGKFSLLQNIFMKFLSYLVLRNKRF